MSLRYKRASILIFLLMALTLSLRDVVARETSHTYAQLVTSIDVAFGASLGPLNLTPSLIFERNHKVILHVLFLAYSFVPSGRIKHAGRLVASSAVALFASEVIPVRRSDHEQVMFAFLTLPAPALGCVVGQPG